MKIVTRFPSGEGGSGVSTLGSVLLPGHPPPAQSAELLTLLMAVSSGKQNGEWESTC